MAGRQRAIVRIARGALPFAPGVVIVVALYAVTVLRGGRFLYEERYLVMQALDPTALDRYPVAVLLSLHTQPPMMNGLYALTDDSPAMLQWLLFAAALLSVVLVADTVRASGAGRRWSAFAGAGYALLPSTVLYSLFPYTTTLTALFAVATVWGVARTATWHGAGIAISAVGVGGLFLTRASFTWWVVLGWLAALAILAVRRARGDVLSGTGGRLPGGRIAAITLACCAVGVIAVQSHYWAAFRIPTLSSWSGENLSNALIVVGLSDEAKATLSAQDPCFAQLVAVGAWGPVEAYPACIDPRDSPKTGTPVLDDAERRPPSTGINYNAGGRLALADDWVRLARTAVATEPVAVLRVLTGNDDKAGSVARFLGRSDVYFETLEIPKQTTPALWAALGGWSAVFPYLAWTIIVLAALLALVRARMRRELAPAFWFGAALLLVHAVPSLVGDYGENQRFRAETDPVLVAVAVIAVAAAFRALRAQAPSVADSKADTASSSPSTSSTTERRP